MVGTCDWCCEDTHLESREWGKLALCLKCAAEFDAGPDDNDEPDFEYHPGVDGPRG